MCLLPPEPQEAGARGLDPCGIPGIGGAPLQAGSAQETQGQTGTPGFPAGPARAPAQGHPARGSRDSGAEPDLPAVGEGGDRPGPSHGSVARHRGGEGAPGRPGLRRRKRPWETASAAPPRRGRGGAGAGPDFLTGSPSRGAETRQPTFAMKRPKEPSGSDCECDRPVDVGQEGELR
ncbi:hypothetical protein P7K49_016025 [Saguinus oedipus]|uniref:Collagen alpha-1(I) chain-like n=1 Tax=Saguinus oedipus TaxID=9490 RepID=A0ABQ9VAX1_SAGOE|nr:hypothetical protein P7K49_016025 [Saguinus oedipus]